MKELDCLHSSRGGRQSEPSVTGQTAAACILGRAGSAPAEGQACPSSGAVQERREALQSDQALAG